MHEKSPGVSQGFLMLSMLWRSAALARLALVATDGTTFEVLSLHTVQSCLSFFLVGHFYKSKSA